MRLEFILTDLGNSSGFWTEFKKEFKPCSIPKFESLIPKIGFKFAEQMSVLIRTLYLNFL